MSAIELTAYPGKILGPIAKVLGWIMNGIYNIVYNLFGVESVTVSIVIITILIYTCLLPLTIKQQKFSKLSQKMQPELKAIQDKYKNRKDQASVTAMNEETQLVYQKYGVSPMGSCVQMLIQMPLLFALYRVFYNIPAYITSIKDYFGVLSNGSVVKGSIVDIISNTSGFQNIMQKIITDYKITSVSVDFTSTDTTALHNYIIDVLYKLPKEGWENLTSYFGGVEDAVNSITPHINNFNYALGKINISDTPWNIMKTSFAGHEWLVLVLALLIPALAYLTQVLNIKLMPQANTGDNDQMARQMKSMNTMMPLMSLFFCFITPTGLGIYWIASAVVRAVQQFFVNKHIQNLDLDDIIKQNQEKAKKKREKMGISEDQIRQAAQMKTKSIESKANYVSSAEKELQLEKARQAQNNAKPGSLASKANMVRDFNEKNKVIVDEIMDKLFDNEFKLLSEEFKSYIAESTINAGLDTTEKNIIPILKSLDLQSITLDEVDRMHPSEIHELFKSFAGDFFVKLYIYGGFGLIFGVNVYLSILIFIIDLIYSKQLNSKAKESKYKLFRE